MARINIEDSIYQDTRFIQLMFKLKDIDKALGVMVRSWAIAQKWYVRSENRMIPMDDWNKQLLPNELFEVGLAEKDSSGEWVRIAGADEQFAWLLQRVEAGRKSGMKRGKQDKNSMDDRILRNGARSILNRAVVEGKLDKPKFCADCGVTGVVIEGHHSDYKKPLEVDWLCKKCHTETHRNIRMSPIERPLDSVERPLTGAEPSSLPLPLPLDKSKKNTNTAIATTSSQPNAVTVYCDAYKNRYGHSPTIGGKQAGVLQRFAKNHPTKFVDLINGFLAMPDAWAIQRSHPVELLESKVNEITRFTTTGKVVTQSHLKQFNQTLDDKMGPEPASIQKILADKKQIKGNV